jgi:caffeoyl-CoA O-methyltransferase
MGAGHRAVHFRLVMIKSYSAEQSLAEYVARVFGDEDDILAGIRERARVAGLPDIAVSRVDGLHLEVLARAVAARKAVEIGTLAGYSGVCLLRGMGDDGTLWTFEAEPRHADVARASFEAAGVAERVHLVVGPAAERLSAIALHGPFDLVFIDADKLGYPAYLSWAAEHLRTGGLVLGDNAFLFGRVASGPADDPAVTAMRAFNETLARGGRFLSTMLPTGEGLAVGVKVR